LYRDSNKAIYEVNKNSPVDCFVACVRAGERKSEPGESLLLRQNNRTTFVVRLFLYKRDSNRAIYKEESRLTRDGCNSFYL